MKQFIGDAFSSGQPSREDLARFARSGGRTIINLRAASEPVEFDEAVEAGRLGLHYLHLPVAGAVDLTPSNVRQFGAAFDRARDAGLVLVHCASANRAGAMVALDQALNRRASLEAALDLGRLAGLTSLEPIVIAIAKQATGG